MPTTPEPPSVRARTPPTPMHGPQYDNYRPYSPRRSTRSTAQNNPYSSLNNDRSPKASTKRDSTPPPTAAKRARFARQPTQLSSPPSSPASPARRRAAQKTPRKTPPSTRKAPANGAASDSDHPSTSLAPPTLDPVTMLPTPTKTPQKRNATALHSTARILSFQPNNPNDIMPSSRKAKKHGRFHSANGFDLYDQERESQREQIDIYTDANARVPEMDEAEDNPFVGPKMSGSRPAPQRRSKRGVTEEEQTMGEASRRDEGVVYMFRGKKIFRRFSDPERERSSSAAASETSDEVGQRALRRQAGAAAQRPLTRSAIKPRLLFPSEEQLLAVDTGPDDVDEEAITDIDMPTALSSAKQERTTHVKQTPAKGGSKPVSPPTTKRTTRAMDRAGVVEQCTPSYEDDAEPMSLSSETFPAHMTRSSGSTRSPFDAWPRTKAGKRKAGEMAEGAGVAKRTRTAVGESPA